MTWWKPSSGGGSSTPEGQSYNTETQKTTFAGEVAAPSVSATGSVTGDNTLARVGSALVAPLPVVAPSVRASQRRFSSATRALHKAPSFVFPSAYTFGDQIPIVAPIAGFVPVWYNYSTSAALQLSASKFAYAPTDKATASGLTWASLKYGGATSALIPVAKNANACSFAIGDFVATPSIARTDFPEKQHLLQIRNYYENGGLFPIIEAANFAAFRTSTELEYAGYTSVGDGVGSPSGAPVSNANAIQTCAILPVYLSRVSSLLVLGDSTNAGEGSTSSVYGASDHAKKLINAGSGALLDVFKIATGGEGGATTYSVWRQIASASIKPTAVLIPTWSLNNGYTSDKMATCLAYAMQIASEAMALGIIPIIQTPPPAVGLTGANIAAWQAHYATVLALGSDHIVADQTVQVMDPADPGHYLASLTSDGSHPNQAGHEAKGIALRETLRKIGL